MAGICCGVAGGSETSSPSVVTQRSRRRRNEIRQMKFVTVNAAVEDDRRKRQRIEVERECENAVGRSCVEMKRLLNEQYEELESEKSRVLRDANEKVVEDKWEIRALVENNAAKFGMASVCGRRRDMEDAVSIYPSFCRQVTADLHFYGVYDGHGCSHVALKCKAEMHQIVKDAVDNEEQENWKETMERSFSNMDKKVEEYRNTAVKNMDCKCELQMPRCDTVGSTAVVSIVTPDKIIVSNCGDSRAVLCRNGVAIPLSADHKPDRPDELERIEAAGGRVIYWQGARVSGVLAMSRAIGDNYLKPYVISEPEVTITDRTVEDECLILASDGLWDVVSNELACGIVRKCLSPRVPPLPPGCEVRDLASVGVLKSDKACMQASILLMKLALARNSSDNISVVVVDLRRNL